MEKDTLFIGLDVHKATIAVALASSKPPKGVVPEVRYYGTIASTPEALRGLCKRLLKGPEGDAVLLHFCYEAGPFGYGAQRLLTELGHRCDVVAPSLIPRRAGSRVKTDRRDAILLAETLRAGQLSGIWVPDRSHEAIRDLVRLREQAVRDQRRSRQQLLSFLLCHGLECRHENWTKAHRRWLAELRLGHPAQHLVLEELLGRIERAEALCERLKPAIAELVGQSPLAPTVSAVQALRGFSLINAAVVVTEVGDFSRFTHPRQLMAYLGLTPSEHSSGATVRRGGITGAGSAMARTALVEAAWAYRHPARRTPVLLKRLEGLPEDIQAVAWKAQVRLSTRYRQLLARGKSAPTAIVALARELAGFVWAIARLVAPPPAAPHAA